MNKTSYLSAAAAFLIWGAWAYYVNSSSGVVAGSKAAVAQGTASFVITLVMVRMAALFMTKLARFPLAWLWAAVLTVTCTGSGLVLIHTLAETSDILTTITPALTVALAFCLFTTWNLRHVAKTESTRT